MGEAQFEPLLLVNGFQGGAFRPVSLEAAASSSFAISKNNPARIDLKNPAGTIQGRRPAWTSLWNAFLYLYLPASVTPGRRNALG
ncbi:hypothetical protein ACPA9J_10165 [Pseudomonas aeruginosa]